MQYVTFHNNGSLRLLFNGNEQLPKKKKKNSISVLGKKCSPELQNTKIKFGCHFKPSPFLISHRHTSQQCHPLSSKTVLLFFFVKGKKKTRKAAIDLRSNKVILKF